MNKTELIAKLAETTELKKVEAERALAAFIDIVTTELVNGEKVQITGFGSFEVRDRAARVGRNPQTGEEIQIAASKAPAFKAGASLKAEVNK